MRPDGLHESGVYDATSKSCGPPIPCNPATLPPETATTEATRVQPVSLKALAINALQRNSRRNSGATTSGTECNQECNQPATNSPELHSKLHESVEKLHTLLQRNREKLHGMGSKVAHASIESGLSPDTILDQLSSQDIADLDRGTLTQREMTCFAKALAARQIRDAGIAPTNYTQAAECDLCGPVWLWAGAPPTVMGCPWCFNRLAGKPIPRPQTIEYEPGYE